MNTYANLCKGNITTTDGCKYDTIAKRKVHLVLSNCANMALIVMLKSAVSIYV